MPKIESGKPLHCVELVTGKSLTGTVLISEDELRADIYSYTGHFHINGEQPVFLQTERNEIVSLHSNVTTIPGTSSRNIAPLREARRQEILSNVAVVGHDSWQAEDGVKRVSFQVKHTNQLMRHESKVKAIGRARFPTEEHLTIFNDAAQGMRVRAWYGATYGMEFEGPKELWTMFGLEFDEPQGIRDYIGHVSDYVNFLSFCFGVQLKPSSIRIDRLSFAQMMEAIEKHEYPGDHEVHYIWPEAEADNRDLWVGGSPVRCWDDKELASFRECLIAWMNRAAAWRRPNALMMTSFGLKNVVSSERLLNACRWFEDIPIAKAQPVLSGSDVNAIAAVAAAKAQELGHEAAIGERVAGAIRWIRAETAEQQFSRLVGLFERKFGKGVVPDEAVEHLKRATYFRGKSAHGHFNPESDAQFRAFSKSTRAMESLCYLLTALELPISEEGRSRVGSNSVLRDYRMAYD
ncbi:hypothetical protein [Bradyrhizobium retamae]|uniref:ApeA N-terminal domain-containing protein n=1 Tax=Bradyrhizobium retamae TaxID=1300035 RepID=A0A0R3NAE5_9BRAD|nr:hypothetical protein [Bradyrhizobium retamae]KRR29115.1 hypothetical protein CQ13_18420 [Bradyrhizobium retamae]